MQRSGLPPLPPGLRLLPVTMANLWIKAEALSCDVGVLRPPLRDREETSARVAHRARRVPCRTPSLTPPTLRPGAHLQASVSTDLPYSRCARSTAILH